MFVSHWLRGCFFSHLSFYRLSFAFSCPVSSWWRYDISESYIFSWQLFSPHCTRSPSGNGCFGPLSFPGLPFIMVLSLLSNYWLISQFDTKKTNIGTVKSVFGINLKRNPWCAKEFFLLVCRYLSTCFCSLGWLKSSPKTALYNCIVEEMLWHTDSFSLFFRLCTSLVHTLTHIPYYVFHLFISLKAKRTVSVAHINKIDIHHTT